jgi:hypothetical protein
MKLYPIEDFNENCRFVLDSAEQGQKLNAILKGNTPLLTFKKCLSSSTMVVR